MQSEIIVKHELRPCIVHNRDSDENCLFHGFCENNMKVLVEDKNGELHKADVWRVQFVDGEINKYHFPNMDQNQNKVNPYNKYSYDSGLVTKENEPVFSIDTKWNLWQIGHGKGITSLKEKIK